MNEEAAGLIECLIKNRQTEKILVGFLSKLYVSCRNQEIITSKQIYKEIEALSKQVDNTLLDFEIKLQKLKFE